MHPRFNETSEAVEIAEEKPHKRLKYLPREIYTHSVDRSHVIGTSLTEFGEGDEGQKGIENGRWD